MLRRAALALVAIAALAAPVAAQSGADDEGELLVDEARALIDRGRYEEAGALLDRAIAANPRQVHAFILRASVHGVAGEHARAITMARRALALAPSNLDAQSALGVQLVLAGRAEEGVPILEQVVAAEPARYEAQLLLGKRYGEARRWPEAVRAYRAYLAHRPSALRGRDPEHQVELARALLRSDRPGDARDLYRAVLAARPRLASARLGLLWATAAIDCRELPAVAAGVADLMRRFPVARLVVAQCELAVGDLAAAERRARAYVERVPRDPNGWAVLARARQRRGDLDGAHAAILQARSVAPADRRWSLELARIDRLRGNPAVAARRLRAAGPPAGLEREWTLELAEAALAAGEHAAVRAILLPYVAAERDDAEARVILGLALVAAGELDTAIDHLDRAVRGGGGLASRARMPLARALRARGTVHLRAGELGRARDYLARSLELAPSARGRILVASVALAAGDPAAAVPLLEAAGDDPIALHLLGRAHRRTGDREAAIRALERAGEVAPRGSGTRARARLELASILVARDPGRVAALLEAELEIGTAMTAQLGDAYDDAARAHARQLLAGGAYRRAYRLLDRLRGRLAADDPRVPAVRCDLALAATGAGMRGPAQAALRGLADDTRCELAAPADELAVPILRAWNGGLDGGRASAALARLNRLRRRATGPAEPLWQAAVADVALRAAQAAHDRRNLAAARRYLAIARRRSPRAPAVEHNRAVLLLESRKTDDAIAILRGLTDQVPEAHLNLAIAYERKGDPERALRQLERAAAAGVSHPKLASWIESKRRVWGTP